MTRQTLLWHHVRGDNNTMHHTMAPTDAWVAPAIGQIGGDAFHTSLLQGLHAALGVDHLSYLRYDCAGRIRQAASASLQDQMLIESTTDLYVNRLYERDPNYTLLCNDGHAAGPAVRMLATAPAGIRDAEYRRLLFEKPGFVGKLSLLGNGSDGTSDLNLYFSRQAPARSRAAAVLQRHGATLISLAHRHAQLVTAAPAVPIDPLDSLSPREREIARLLREGLTVKQSAARLGLSPATVVTYKQRAYEKLGVGNLKQLLALG